MRNVSHKEHQGDYKNGFNDTIVDIRGMGIKAAAEKHLMDNPTDCKPSSLASYYYAEGGIDAIYQFKNGMVK